MRERGKVRGGGRRREKRVEKEQAMEMRENEVGEQRERGGNELRRGKSMDEWG